MNPIFDRQCARLTYRDPEELLRELLPDFEKMRKEKEGARLTREERKQEERFQGALVAWMIQKVVGSQATVAISLEEVSDFDCVIRGISKRGAVFQPVQLKGLPSHAANTNISLQDIVDDLKQKYPTSSKLVVVVEINRDVQIDLSDVDTRGLAIGQLWLLGDRPNGSVRITGGVIPDWDGGKVWEGVIQDGNPNIKIISFVPKHRSN